MSNCNWKTNITKRIVTRVPELKENTELLNELLEEAFVDIMNHSQATSYNKSWDSTLVTCVVTLYNYSGMEGSTNRSANGVSDTYESSDILSPILSRKIPHYIKPSGYTLPDTRFNMPD